MSEPIQNYLLKDAGAVITGSPMPCTNGSNIAIFIFAGSVTAGAIIKIEALSPKGDWHPVDSITITANGASIPILLTAAYSQIRARISSWTDGLYNVSYLVK